MVEWPGVHRERRAARLTGVVAGHGVSAGGRRRADVSAAGSVRRDRERRAGRDVAQRVPRAVEALSRVGSRASRSNGGARRRDDDVVERRSRHLQGGGTRLSRFRSRDGVRSRGGSCAGGTGARAVRTDRERRGRCEVAERVIVDVAPLRDVGHRPARGDRGGAG